MFENWKKDRKSVHASWDAYFENVTKGLPPGQAFVQPPPVASGSGFGARPSFAAGHTPAPFVFTDGLGSLPSAGSIATPEAIFGSSQSVHDTSRIIQMVRGYQTRGHELATLDPLALPKQSPFIPVTRKESPRIDYKHYGFTESDLDRVFDCRVPGMSGFLSPEREPRTLRELVTRLEETYSSSIGVEYMHIGDPNMCNFIRQAIETPQKFNFSRELKRKILVRTARSQLFENFCGLKFSTSKRFGLDGCETMVVAMKAITKKAAKSDVSGVVIGMPHRGRLNMLMNVMHKPMPHLMSEFKGITGFGEAEWGNSGDVKYHMGIEHDHWDKDSGKYVHMALLANPSHLEAVNPLVNGQARAMQYFMGDKERKKVLPIVLHGDASVAGQGVVFETLQMSKLPNYTTGGTIHIVVNNQVGFTTMPADAGSGKYCTDLGKAIDAPVFHVNADDPEAVTFVAELALDFRQKFQSDVIIDIVGYRRYGHNELDMPKFTQPLMYNLIGRHDPVFEIYSKKLLSEGVVTPEELVKVRKDIETFYENEYEKSKSWDPKSRPLDAYQPQWAHMKRPSEMAVPRVTGVEVSHLTELGKKISTLPETVTPHPTIAKLFKARQDAMETGKDIDFGLAECLAYASLLTDGFHIRLTGQDVQRGTFSHRHAIVHDQSLYNQYNIFSPLKTPHTIEIGNSFLSEYAVMGFEFGYSLQHPDTLSIWEAQFGDFANGAQIIIDQFLVSGESKWGRQSVLTLLLPHGYDGQGPEHSSARIERFLQLCDDREDLILPETWDVKERSIIQQHNVQVVNCTMPSQTFHVLRRQMHREFRKPLVVFSPKRMLKQRMTFSSIEEFGTGTRFRRYIPNVDFGSASNKPEEVSRLIICSGQVYYDLASYRDKIKAYDVHISRVEQLSPFPFDEVVDDLKRYPNLKSVVWAQEEPMNMGPWFYTGRRLETCLEYMKFPNDIHRPIYVGRDVAASPAVGDAKLHEKELNRLLTDAFDSSLTKNSYYNAYMG